MGLWGGSGGLGCGVKATAAGRIYGEEQGIPSPACSPPRLFPLPPPFPPMLHQKKNVRRELRCGGCRLPKPYTLHRKP